MPSHVLKWSEGERTYWLVRYLEDDGAFFAEYMKAIDPFERRTVRGDVSRDDYLRIMELIAEIRSANVEPDMDGDPEGVLGEGTLSSSRILYRRSVLTKKSAADAAFAAIVRVMKCYL